jgi:hypothetical protein
MTVEELSVNVPVPGVSVAGSGMRATGAGGGA